MMTLGAKLHINTANMVATIKRGLLPPIKMHVMTCGVDEPHELIQQATLAENYYIRTPNAVQYNNSAPQTQRVHFDANNVNAHAHVYGDDLMQTNNDLKHMINQLTQQFEKFNVNAIASLQHRSRSPTPFRMRSASLDNNSRNNSQTRHYVNSATNTPFCTYCNSQGHIYDHCKLRQQVNRQRQQEQPRFYQRQYQPFRGRPTQRPSFMPSEAQRYLQPARRDYYSRNNNANETRRFNNNNNQAHLN